MGATNLSGRKSSQILRTQNETKKKVIAVPGRERVDNQWEPQNQIHNILDLERKRRHKILPSFLDQTQTDSEELTLVRILTLYWLLPVFPGSPLQAPEPVGVKVESVALVSTGIWQDFPLILILVSPWLFKGMMGSSLLKNPSEFCMGRGYMGSRYGGIQVGVEGFDKNLQGQSFSSIPVDYK